MNKRFILSAGMDVSITLSIDMAKLTADLAREINGFWSGAEEVLRSANGDVVEAAIRRAGSRLLGSLLGGDGPHQAVLELHEAEGWPSSDELPIEIIDYELPDINPDDLEVTEVDL